MAKRDSTPPPDGTLLGEDPVSRPRDDDDDDAARIAAQVDADEAARRAGAPAIKVRATQRGYYGDKRRRVGDVFIIHGEVLFSPKWMEKVDAHTPERVTTGQADLNRQRRATGDLDVFK